ncbi:MAG: divalent-cation tolerance protein CutA [Anaerovoracaceae bacterium]|jgi:periplasmic divalent cation tolerance protein
MSERYLWIPAYTRFFTLPLFKTRKELYPELEKKLLEIHPYETPEILFVDVDKGSAAYLAWIDEQTR